MDPQLLELFEKHRGLQEQITGMEIEIKNIKAQQEQIRRGINNALEKFNYGLITIRHFEKWRDRVPI